MSKQLKLSFSCCFSSLLLIPCCRLGLFVSNFPRGKYVFSIELNIIEYYCCECLGKSGDFGTTTLKMGSIQPKTALIALPDLWDVCAKILGFVGIWSK